ncbi:LysR family transcriptional regulator [Paenibacillus sp. sptzw28]|uniref:LysR family transcriptional regulator n=1 Tax=Paenibacillus sp. sptzw28 TaxID=715179 RepID=UPI001C6F3232|nr:LysR family transcriptional regulator [Paenibacillus sp. sptzw28]QYR23156.1 LysR family transcriptional regulator [Paenibacillus sp. sptzw28]
MELTDLKIVIVIMEEGSISRAAEKLGYVQSNVTARIRKLETELGIHLFSRHPKGVTPTEKGLTFSKYALEILRKTEEAVMAVKEPEYPCGPLAIGVVETIASSGPFIQALSKFQRQYPEVALSLVPGTSPQNYENVLSRQLDGAFFTGDFDTSALEVEVEIQDQVVLLTAAENETSEYPSIEDAAWVVFPKGCPFRTAVEEWLRSRGASNTNIIEISTMETMLSCVRAGLGFALVPKSALAGDNELLRVYPVPEPYQYATTRLVRRNEQFRSKAFAAFAECVRTTGF